MTVIMTGMVVVENRSEKQVTEVATLTDELTNALTAVGLYTSAACRMLDLESRPRDDVVRQALEKSVAQLSRAAEVLRLLQRTAHREAIQKDFGRTGLLDKQ